jgi:hypothetical protein
MVSQVASPGVQHAHHANLSTKPTWFVGELLSGCRRGFEEQIMNSRWCERATWLKAAGNVKVSRK